MLDLDVTIQYDLAEDEIDSPSVIAEECQSAKDKETAEAATLDLSDEGTEDDTEKVDLDQEKPFDDIPYPLSKPRDTTDLDETLSYSQGKPTDPIKEQHREDLLEGVFVHAIQTCEKPISFGLTPQMPTRRGRELKPLSHLQEYLCK